jgi:hypothetical protein
MTRILLHLYDYFTSRRTSDDHPGGAGSTAGFLPKVFNFQEDITRFFRRRTVPVPSI